MRETETTSGRQEAMHPKEREAIEIDIANEPSTSSVGAQEPGLGGDGIAATHGHGGEVKKTDQLIRTNSKLQLFCPFARPFIHLTMNWIRWISINLRLCFCAEYYNSRMFDSLL